jgi:Flp pilus assembly protein CpaB
MNQMARNRRLLLLIGAVLAVAAFALVVLLLNQKAGTTPTAAQATATVVSSSPAPGTTPGAGGTAVASVPTDTATVAIGSASEVTAIQNVPAGTKLTDMGTVAHYFRTQAAAGAVPINAVPSTAVLATSLVSNTIQVLSPIKRGTILTTDQYQLLPFSPPNSLAYNVRVGRVAESVQVPLVNSDNGAILPGDFVNVLLTLHDRDLSAYTSSPPDAANNGPIQTQELLPDIRVVAVAPTGLYTLEVTPQESLVLKYAKDYGAQIELVLMSSVDVKSQAAQPPTNAVVPDFFLTPVAVVRGTPQGNGVPYPFATPLPGIIVKPTVTG